MLTGRTRRLSDSLAKLYQAKSQKLLYHGWHHVCFVAKKSIEFAKEADADERVRELIEAAALTHDLNYIVQGNTEPDAGKGLREKYLRESGFNEDEIQRIGKIVEEAHMSTRHADISEEAKILSDADTLFKVVPISHLIFTPHYFSENDVDIKQLADKIIKEQIPLLKGGIYFYNDKVSKKYLKWAEVNLALWEQIYKAMDDKDVQELAKIAKKLKVTYR